MGGLLNWVFHKSLKIYESLSVSIFYDVSFWVEVLYRCLQITKEVYNFLKVKI